MIIVGNSAGKALQPVSIDVGDASGKVVKAVRVMAGDASGKAREVWSGSSGYLVRLVGSNDNSSSNNYWIATEYSTNYGKTWTRVLNADTSRQIKLAKGNNMRFTNTYNILLWLNDRLYLFAYDQVTSMYNPNPNGDGTWTMFYAPDNAKLYVSRIMENGLIFSSGEEYRDEESAYRRDGVYIYNINDNFSRIACLRNTEYYTYSTTYIYYAGYEGVVQINSNIYLVGYSITKTRQSDYVNVSIIHYVDVVYINNGIVVTKNIDTYTDTDLTWSGSGKIYNPKFYRFADGAYYTYFDYNSYKSGSLIFKKVMAEYSNGLLSVNTESVTISDTTIANINFPTVQYRQTTFNKDGKFYYMSEPPSETFQFCYKRNMSDIPTIVRNVSDGAIAGNALTGKYFYSKSITSGSVIAFNEKEEFATGLSNIATGVLTNMTFVPAK